MPATTPAQLPVLFQDALNAADLDAVLLLFAPGAAMRTVTGEYLTTPEALRTEIAGLIAARGRLTNVSRHTLPGGDAALLVTDWTMELDAPDGTRAASSGTTANIARRDALGSWRFALLNPLGTA
ncbi:YybH family protein [Kitasatospora viridis]|uniref:Ketosteroid isomerase-like protein n=1 Tax=Kitasatospora viridis TaxID=281105 RepID=A0A561UQC0_9ACTN|nr:nuclear transport factor 2 family protein [Kitasatospora viridis]TWG01556.1 ketosteroid isomerase-like protein [Kitasatospora viridis]